MRWILLFPALALALDNSIIYTDRTGSTQTDRPFTAARAFVKDDICDYPQPFIGNTGIATWQSDNINRWPASALCPSGSVKRADISFRATVPASSTLTVNFRNNTNPCSSGNRATCDAAALDQAGMLAFNGGTWASTLTTTANPQGSTTTRTTNFRTALGAGLWRYQLRGPVVTRVIVEDASTSLTLDHGWKEALVVRLTGSLGTTTTDIPVENISEFTGLSRPFTIEIDGEQIGVCFVGASSLTVGTTNGGSAACATTSGRGLAGTTAANHSQNVHGNWIRPVSTIWLTTAPGPNGTTFTVNDGSSINAVTLVQAGFETARVCNRSGNDLTIGIGAWPCTADLKGRRWQGTSQAFTNGNSPLVGTMVRVLTGLSNRWIDAPHDRYKSLHPEAVLTFYAGWAGVGQAIALSNYWTTRLQDQIFDFTYADSGGTEESATAWKMVARTRLRMPRWSVADSQYWDGSAPGELRIDHNAAYMHAAGVLPTDPSVVLSAAGITAELSTPFTTSSGTQEPGWDQAANNRCAETLAALENTTLNSFLTAGSIAKGLDLGGASRAKGIVYGSASRAIASWKSTETDAHRMNEVALWMGSCGGNLPIHYRESATGLSYCAAGSYTANPSDTSCTGGNLSTVAFGLPLSIDARPTVAPNNQINAASGDKFYPVGYTTSNNFGVENATAQHWTSHMPALSWVPYLMTGDPFYGQELSLLAHMMVASATEFPDYTVTSVPVTRMNQRHRSLGWLAMSNGSRTRAWTLRDLSQGAWAAPDGSAEKQYLTSKIMRNIAIDEGRYNVVDGSFYSPCPTPSAPNDDSPWCIGRYKANNADLTGVYSIEVPGQPLCSSSNTDCTQNYYEASVWMDSYNHLAMAHSEALGVTQWSTVRSRIARGFIDRATRDDYNMFLLGTYREPAMPCLPEGTPQGGGCAGQTYTSGAQVGFSTFANLKAAHLSANQSLTAFDPSTVDDYFGGTMQVTWAGFAAVPGIAGSQASGLRAYERLKGTIRAQSYAALPQWAIAPRERITVKVTTGDTALYLSGHTTTSTAPCRVAVGTTLPASLDDAGDTAANMAGREWSYVATGLTAATAYKIRVTCGNGREFATATTTAAAGGGLTATVAANIPGANNIEVQYGAGFGSSASGACSVGACSASVPATTGRVLEYRYRGRDGSNNPITGWSSTTRVIP